MLFCSSLLTWAGFLSFEWKNERHLSPWLAKCQPLASNPSSKAIFQGTALMQLLQNGRQQSSRRKSFALRTLAKDTNSLACRPKSNIAESEIVSQSTANDLGPFEIWLCDKSPADSHCINLAMRSINRTPRSPMDSRSLCESKRCVLVPRHCRCVLSRRDFDRRYRVFDSCAVFSESSRLDSSGLPSSMSKIF